MDKDKLFIRRCIELAERSLHKGEMPFGSVIVKANRILVESENAVKLQQDVTNHAEILVMRIAQKLLKTNDLSGYAIYSNCEPCPMCSFMIRELKFSKVVFGIISPVMGGYTKWKILQDKGLSNIKPFFGEPPIVVSGLLEKEAEKTFIKKSPTSLKNFKGELTPMILNKLE